MADPGNILVVDDELTIRQLLTDCLSEEGHTVRAAATGTDAREALVRHPFDVVILDLRLPDMSGADLLASLDGDRGGRPEIIIITGHATADSAIHALRHEVYDYIQKPFAFESLVASVRNALEKRRLAAQNADLLKQLQQHKRGALPDVAPPDAQPMDGGAPSGEERNRMLAILHSLGEAVVTCGLDTRVTFLNAEAERVLGIPAGKAAGRRWATLLGIPPTQCPVRATLATDAGLREVRMGVEAHNGESRTVRLSTSLFRNNRGEPAGVAIVFRDVGAEEQLERMKSEFITAASHELRTPLTSIRGYVELLLDGTPGELNERQRECIEAVDRNSAKLRSLVETILDLSRIEGGVFQVLLEPTDLATIATAASAAAEERAREDGVDVLVCPQANMPTVESDPRRVRQVIEELLNNAIQHTPSGGQVRVAVSANGDDSAVVTVSDEGVGIPREHLDRIFDKFHRLNGVAEQDGNGVGLGLSIAKAIVERLGGAIAVESSLGHGATFTVSLPARPP
ncbi:MAG: ATP-binding protein [Armatimonadota bacterium]|jgi:PAS domain S-box-containing protein